MTQLPPTRAETPRDLLARLLDKGYTQATSAALSAIARAAETGLLAQRLAELDAEAARLAAAGLRLTPDNAVLRGLQADFETVLLANGALVRMASEDVQNAAIQAAATITRQLALPGLNDAALRSVGMAWNTPDPNAVAAVVRYTSQPEFSTWLTHYAADALDRVQQVVTRGVLAGQGAAATARDVRMVATGMPVAQANTLMRTLQLTAYRDATVIHQVANADIVGKVIRVAALDTRTCMACVALHGTEIPLGQRVDDHPNGRCTSVVIVRGRQYNGTTGEDWFNSLPEARQRQQMGDAAYEAWQAGTVNLQDFVHPYRDELFGPMLREASLKGMLGSSADAYYRRQAG